ncbi:hypothetical protein D3C85_1026300 [compost metagenome]
MDVFVEGIFLFEEDLVLVVARLVAVVKHADVAARTEGFLTGGTQHYGEDLRILFPGMQLLQEQTHHGQGQGIQPTRTSQRQVADAVADCRQNGRFDIAHAQASLRYRLMIAEKSRPPLPWALKLW